MNKYLLKMLHTHTHTQKKKERKKMLHIILETTGTYVNTQFLPSRNLEFGGKIVW